MPVGRCGFELQVRTLCMGEKGRGSVRSTEGLQLAEVLGGRQRGFGEPIPNSHLPAALRKGRKIASCGLEHEVSLRLHSTFSL